MVTVSAPPALEGHEVLPRLDALQACSGLEVKEFTVRHPDDPEPRSPHLVAEVHVIEVDGQRLAVTADRFEDILDGDVAIVPAAAVTPLTSWLTSRSPSVPVEVPGMPR